MRPVERLAVDVFLEQGFAHHQAEILARAAPRRIRRFVDDVPEIVEPSRRGGFASLQPRLARLPAFPSPRREAEYFDLYPATLERARQNVRACRGNRDRAPRIEPELSRSSVTTVSRKSMSRSRLNDSGCCGSVITRDKRAGSSMPSSRSNSHERFCCAIRRRCSRLARRATIEERFCNCLSR